MKTNTNQTRRRRNAIRQERLSARWRSRFSTKGTEPGAVATESGLAAADPRDYETTLSHPPPPAGCPPGGPGLLPFLYRPQRLLSFANFVRRYRRIIFCLSY